MSVELLTNQDKHVELPDDLESFFLVLLYYEDRSVAEIAATLGISAGTVKSRLHAARAAMRAAIDADSRMPVRAGEPA